MLKKPSIIVLIFVEKVSFFIQSILVQNFTKDNTMREFFFFSKIFRQGNWLLSFSHFRALYIWCFGQRHYIYRERSTGRSFVHSECRDATAARRSLPRPAYLSANATYKHQFNVWNLSKWISPGSCFSGPSFFFPRRMRSWCEISLYYCAVTWGVSGRFPLLLFQDNPFERQDTSLCDEKYDYISLLLYFFIFNFAVKRLLDLIIVVQNLHVERGSSMCHKIFNNISLCLFYFTFEHCEILFVTKLISSTNFIIFILSVAIFLI